jgi:Tol biopolymer transport system component
MNADGSGMFPVTDYHPFSPPSWSPNGQRIAFSSDHDGDWQIYVANVDGSGVTPLPGRPGWELDPSWSPDGQRIVYTYFYIMRGEWKPEVWLMNSDGSNRTFVGVGSMLASPKWSPDGSRILFVYGVDGKLDNLDVYTMGIDGSDWINLTQQPGWNVYPSWSPDGRHIAFSSDRDGDHEIYVMNRDGRGVRRLTDNPATEMYPTWSPDGRRIAFMSTREGNLEIYVMNADGTGVTRLTHHGASDSAPSWSP